MVYAALVTSRPLLMVVNAGATNTINSAVMPTTMSSSRSVKPAAAVGVFSSIGLRRVTGGFIVKISRHQPPDIDERHDVGWINNFYGNPGPKFPGNLGHQG